MRHDVEYQNHKNRRTELIHEAANESLAGMQSLQTSGLSGNVKRVGIVIMLAAVLLTGSLAWAQADSPPAPQWVCDRQQYETRYVYLPDAETVPYVASSAPQWVRDLLQYEVRQTESRAAGALREPASDPSQRVQGSPQYATPCRYREPRTERTYVTPIYGPQ
ncbi:MAG: hypothetical protein IPM16_18020 [Chloroflexi bacterium]|nr:hypothetical protein [Chloroflexota bacterium]